MIPALAKAIDSLFSPGRFGLSRQSRGQRSPPSVYACAVDINLVSVLRQTSLLLFCCMMHAKFSLPPSTILVGYLCAQRGSVLTNLGRGAACPSV